MSRKTARWLSYVMLALLAVAMAYETGPEYWLFWFAWYCGILTGGLIEANYHCDPLGMEADDVE